MKQVIKINWWFLIVFLSSLSSSIFDWLEFSKNEHYLKKVSLKPNGQVKPLRLRATHSTFVSLPFSKELLPPSITSLRSSNSIIYPFINHGDSTRDTTVPFRVWTNQKLPRNTVRNKLKSGEEVMISLLPPLMNMMRDSPETTKDIKAYPTPASLKLRYIFSRDKYWI